MGFRSLCAAAAALGCTVLPVFGEDVFLHHHHVSTARQLSELDQKIPPATAITPFQMREAYGFSQVANQGEGQTIGIVDAFDDPQAEADLSVFNSEYGLPACTTANGCFKKVYASGKKPLGNLGWSQEISLDIQWAHAIAPQARICLVEAASSSSVDLYKAVDAAVRDGATVISMSFGSSETPAEIPSDAHFKVAGVAFVASAGDSDHGVEYPAASPYVIGVGGTTLTQNNGSYVREKVWNTKASDGTAGGVSVYELGPAYQTPFQNMGLRGVPDLAYDADPNTGVAIYDSYGGGKWVQIGGTSLGAPQIAAAIAIVKSSRAAAGKSGLQFPAAIYRFMADYHDITMGNDGGCGSICNAKTGYDFTTGVGTPIANALIPALVALP